MKVWTGRALLGPGFLARLWPASLPSPTSRTCTPHPHPHLGCRAVKGGIRVPDPVPPAKFYGLLMELQVVRDPEDGQKRGDWLPLQRGMG